MELSRKLSRSINFQETQTLSKYESKQGIRRRDMMSWTYKHCQPKDISLGNKRCNQVNEEVDVLQDVQHIGKQKKYQIEN